MDHYGFLLVFIGRNRCLCVLLGLSGSLLVFIGPYRSFCVLIGSYGSILVRIELVIEIYFFYSKFELLTNTGHFLIFFFSVEFYLVD